MIRIFGKWLGIDIEVNQRAISISLGLYYIFYLTIYWRKIKNCVSLFPATERYIQLWKHIELGVIK
jgi:hypothetical protein